MTSYLLSVLASALFICLLALGLNLQWGHAGLLNFGHIAFFAIGAYTFATVSNAGVPPVIAIVLAVAFAAVLSLPLSLAGVRLKSDYLAIVTLAFSECLRLVLAEGNWAGGPSGLTGVPRLFGDLRLDQFTFAWVGLLTIVTAIVAIAFHMLYTSPYGRALRAVRDDPVATRALGRNTVHLQTSAFAWGSAVAGLAGALYASWVGYVVPDQFVPLQTFYVWIGIILGGSSLLGTLGGTLFVALLLESTRFLPDLGIIPLSSAELASVRFMLIGLALIVLVTLRPNGVFPFTPERDVRRWIRRNRPDWAMVGSSDPRPSIRGVSNAAR